MGIEISHHLPQIESYNPYVLHFISLIQWTTADATTAIHYTTAIAIAIVEVNLLSRKPRLQRRDLENEMEHLRRTHRRPPRVHRRPLVRFRRSSLPHRSKLLQRVRDCKRDESVPAVLRNFQPFSSENS
ncbi:hypothetical protein OSB04_010935 [Centaurea solstitialis]|uniref:Uncharacterized protein n=1 Tax=Centaurea solstitialis TaxID=347529 RepID=A0AA38TLN5_9ASTR|nr:hypothetical protein OSB04_010935 [Centaurea solstitialis]